MSEKPTNRRLFLKSAASASALAAANSALGAATVDQTEEATSFKPVANSGGGPMPHRPLGATGEQVPILHLGTSQRLDPVYDKIMHRCLKSGVNWFDTALAYGWGASHSAIANFLNQTKARRDIWLTSKSGSGSPEGLAKGLDEALMELNTDYLDIFLMHGINDEDRLGKAFLAAGDRFRRSGKTRFFGFSCHDGNVAELLSKAAKVGGIDVILFRYNFRRYGDLALNKAMDACHRAGIGLLAMKSMGSVPASLESVVEFRSENNFTLGQAKLKSIWADERISSVVSEMDSVQRVRENVNAAKTERNLTAQESHQLNRLAALTAQYACNGCSHLCEQAAGGGVAIADSLRFLMYHECYGGKSERAKTLYGALPTAARQCSTDQLAAAAAVCPQGIDIAARMAKAQAVLN